MMRGDGKDRFYRTLNLDNDLRRCMRHFREIQAKMKRDTVQQDLPEEEIK